MIEAWDIQNGGKDCTIWRRQDAQTGIVDIAPTVHRRPG